MTVANSDNFENTLEYVAPTAGVTVGVPIKIQDTVCLPLATAAATVAFAAKVYGRIKNAPAATTQAWVAGQVLYWDNSGAKFTTSATGNTKIGSAAAIKASAAAVGDVLLLNR